MPEQSDHLKHNDHHTNWLGVKRAVVGAITLGLALMMTIEM